MRRYAYVGPEHVRSAATGAPAGTPIGSPDELARWISSQHDADGAALTATFVVALDGAIRVANRRSEHVACAAGQPVLSAGEIRFSLDGTRVVAASNLSTGYCPEPESWPAVADALDRAGIAHGLRFDDEMTFRRCPECGERNVVKDSWFVCAICNAALPADWNLG